MASPTDPQPSITPRDAHGTVTSKTADSTGPDAASDPRLAQQLRALSGNRLSQFSIGIDGVRLSFWGQDTATPSRQIVIEQELIRVTMPGQRSRLVPSRSELIATALVSTLGHQLTRALTDEGHLNIAFDNGLEISVAPHEQWEAWQITSADHLLIVCTPGGQLTIWYPDQID
jgi:hypothetical protein